MTSLKGNLGSVDLANIFQMLSFNQREGTLYIFDGASRKAIYFGRDGVSILSKGKSKTDTLGRILLRLDLVTPADLDAALAIQEETGRMVGQVLVEKSFCSRADVERALQVQIEEEVYGLFIWKGAQFEFVEGQPDEEFRVEGVQKLTFNVNSLIMESARRLDEWDWIRGAIPDTEDIYRFTGRNSELTDAVFQQTWTDKVLAAIDGRRTVDQVVADSYVGRFEVCKAMALLLDAGAIEKLPVPDLRREAESAVAAGDTSEAVKYLSRLVAAKADTPFMHRQLAEAFEARHELEKAAKHYRIYAEIQVDQHDVREAFLVYRRICTALPTELSAADRMIEVYALDPTGLEDHAQEVVDRAKQLAEVYTELGRGPRAIQVLHRVVAIRPEDQDLRRRLIQVYLANGMPGEAADEYLALAERAVAANDLAAAEEIYRKVLTIDRNRDDAVSRLNQILSRKTRRKRNVRNAVGMALVAGALAFAAWAGVQAWRSHREAHSQFEAEASARLAKLREESTPVTADIEGLLQEFQRKADLQAQARMLKDVLPRQRDVQARATAILASMQEMGTDYPDTRANEDAVADVKNLNARLGQLQQRTEGIMKALHDAAGEQLAQAHVMMQAREPTRDVREKLRLAMVLTEDCPGWIESEQGQECFRFAAEVDEALDTFAAVKARVEQRLTDGETEEAFRAALDYLCTKFAPPDLRAEMPVPVRVESKPSGARVTVDGVQTDRVTPCLVNVSVPKGATIDLDLQGFATARLTLPALHNADPAALREQVRPVQVVELEKARVFRRETADGGRVSPAPMLGGRWVVVPTRGKSCDVLDRDTGQPREPLVVSGTSGVSTSGVILQRGEDGATVVLPTAEGAVLFYDLPSARHLGTWNETRGALPFDLLRVGDRVLAADSKGVVHCIDVATRRTVWQYSAVAIDGTLSGISGAPVLADGRIYVGCEDGSVHVVDPASGTKLDVVRVRSALGAYVCGPVATTPEAIYVVTREGPRECRITRWDLATRRIAWTEQFTGELRGAPMVQGPSVACVTASGEIASFRLVDGRPGPVHTIGANLRVLAEPVLDGSVVYVGCDNGVLYALDLRGPAVEPVWKYAVRNSKRTGVPITTRVVASGDLLVFGADDRAVHALKWGN